MYAYMQKKSIYVNLPPLPNSPDEHHSRRPLLQRGLPRAMPLPRVILRGGNSRVRGKPQVHGFRDRRAPGFAGPLIHIHIYVFKYAYIFIYVYTFL